ncbi:unknown [Oscillibacter sp. CAG:155]|nr:unknown [Oscillibacter sp. CAG:155]
MNKKTRAVALVLVVVMVFALVTSMVAPYLV